MSYQPPPPDDKRTVGAMVFDVSERVSMLVREEIELAKAEVSEKIAFLVRGSVVGLVAGLFGFLGLILLMHSIAWLLNDLFFGDQFWLGFLIEAVVFFIVAAIAGLIAYRAVQAGAPPTPDLAIEEGRRIKQTLEAGTSASPGATTPGTTPPATTTPGATTPGTTPAGGGTTTPGVPAGGPAPTPRPGEPRA